jgi:DNA polymerase zeta
MNRVATILQSGSVMSQRFPVFESHLSFTLQFMCDFGLYGCGPMEISKAYRRTVLGSDGDTLPEQVTSFEPSPYPPQTRMPIELDVISPEIVNRSRLKQRCLHDRLVIPGLERPSEPIVTSVRELWEEERRRRRALGMDPSPELPQDPSEASRETNGGWIAEARWWDEIRSRLECERLLNQCQSGSTLPWEGQVMSVFESTEAFWETHYRTWKPDNPGIDETPKHDAVVLNESDLSMIGDALEGGEVDVNEDLLAHKTTSDLGDAEEDRFGNEEHDATDEEFDGEDTEADEVGEESDTERRSGTGGVSRLEY